MPVLSLIGDLIRSKPKVPEIPEISLEAEQGKAIGANLENLGVLEELTRRSNQLGLSEALKRIDEILGPGTRADLTDRVTANIRSGLSGELPRDVVDQIRRRSAETATAGGFAGSEFARNLNLRDLGLTSLQLSQASINSAASWLAQGEAFASSVPSFNFTSMFVTPQEQTAVTTANVERQFQRQFVSNQIDAAFSTGTAFANFLQNMDDTIVQLASSYLGGGLGGMLGGGGGGGGGARGGPSGSGVSGGGGWSGGFGVPQNFGAQFGGYA